MRRIRWPSPKKLAQELASGKWKKAKDFLGDEVGGYCCLGVAARLAGYSDSDLGDFGCLRYATNGEPMGRYPQWLDNEKEERLIIHNDASDDWQPVIDYLESIA